MLERLFFCGQRNPRNDEKGIAYKVAPKVLVRDGLSPTCTTEGPGASLFVLGISGVPNTLIIPEVTLRFFMTVETLVITVVSTYWVATVIKDVI